MRAIACALFFGLSACTTMSGPMDVEGKVDSWLGMNANMVTEAWGNPSQEVQVGPETRVVQYASTEQDEACRVVLTFNARGEVVATKWTGQLDSCSQFVKASPNYEMPIGEETNMAIIEATDNFQSRF